MELDPEIVARIQKRAQEDRKVVDEFNARWLEEQGIEPTQENLDAVCTQNIAAAFAQRASKQRQ